MAQLARRGMIEMEDDAYSGEEDEGAGDSGEKIRWMKSKGTRLVIR